MHRITLTADKFVILTSLFVVLGSPWEGASAAGRSESCVECHKDDKFRVQNKKIYDYYQEWKGSAHDLAGLSCTACHNGDPAKASKDEAHVGIVPQSDPASPFYFKNIPKTCGSCHRPVLERFAQSRHFEQLKTTGRGPTPSTLRFEVADAARAGIGGGRAGKADPQVRGQHATGV
ncbi:MAG: hypothetical protein AABY92_04425, partial [Thermodesulfobacteriota bacterium]